MRRRFWPRAQIATDGPPDGATPPERPDHGSSHPAREEQERHLERVFGQVPVSQEMATDAQHHRPVSLDQRRERRFGCLITANEVIEQAAIRIPPNAPTSKRVQICLPR